MKEHLIVSVIEGSPADQVGIKKGYRLISLNGNEVEDIFDYEYIAEDTSLDITVLNDNNERLEFHIEKEEDENLGLCFEESLMDNYRSCTNKCIFCFIDQNPPGMRETIYFKDDDSRLSFLQGNYITFTNMKEEEIDRIIKFRLAPINISVQTTNPELRKMMLHNRFAGTIMERMKKLYDAEIPMNAQVVLCKGVNDGEELYRTITDLRQFVPILSSLSVVPVGLSKYRDGLYPMDPFTKEDAEEVIDMIEGFQNEIYEEHGIHFVFASDEWYITAGRPLPEADRYDGFKQIENGVGSSRLFLDELKEEVDHLISFRDSKHSFFERFSKEYKEDKKYLSINKNRHVSTIVGALSYGNRTIISNEIKRIRPDIKFDVHRIMNDFYGHRITVTGLLTGGDIVKQLKGKDLGETLLIPDICLKADQDIFLDDMTLAELSEALQVKTVIVKSSGADYLHRVISDD